MMAIYKARGRRSGLTVILLTECGKITCNTAQGRLQRETVITIAESGRIASHTVLERLWNQAKSSQATGIRVRIALQVTLSGLRNDV